MVNEIAFLMQYAHFEKAVWAIVIEAKGDNPIEENLIFPLPTFNFNSFKDLAALSTPLRSILWCSFSKILEAIAASKDGVTVKMLVKAEPETLGKLTLVMVLALAKAKATSFQISSGDFCMG